MIFSIKQMLCIFIFSIMFQSAVIMPMMRYPASVAGVIAGGIAFNSYQESRYKKHVSKIPVNINSENLPVNINSEEAIKAAEIFEAISKTREAMERGR